MLRIEQLEQNEKQLQGKLLLTESVVEEKVKLEQEKTENDEKIAQYKQELRTAAKDLQAQSEKVTDAQKEVESTREQLMAMEETTVSLTRENQEKETKITILQAAVSDKDAQLQQKNQAKNEDDN